MTRTTSRDYANPHRPWPIRALNALGSVLPGRLTGLDPEELTNTAMRAEGIDDFGDPHVRPTLDGLCDAIDREAKLTPMGRIIQAARLQGALRSRLRVEQAHREDRALTRRALPAPIVITGLQRTGTTFLHRLLAADPRLRSLQSWEALAPAPPRKGADRRRQSAHLAARAVGWMAPDFQAVHPIDPEGVEEEVIVLDQTLLSTVAEATMHVPSHGLWLEEQDQTPSYRYLKRTLQLLSRERGPDRWVLKTPHHLEWLDVLLLVFPDARIVHTHRDPVTTVGSFCSMVSHAYGLCSDEVDPHAVGRLWLRKVGRMVDRAAASRVGRESAFVDVYYDDLMEDPLRQIRRVYEHVGLDLPDDVEARIRTTRQDSPQHRFGRHVYELSDFGLTAEQVTDRLSTYRADHGFVG